MPALQPRYYDDCYNDGFRTRCYRNSAWNNWVRWVVLAVIVVGFFLLFILCSCITARRRRRLGRQPYYGTGWAYKSGNNAQPHYNTANNYGQPAPPYTTQQPQNSYYGANQGYYGGQQYPQQNGVELQSPQPTHLRAGDDVYAPPAGPPPGKGDGIVR